MRLALLMIVATLAGCDTGPTRSDVLAGLVGHSEADALRTLGAPNRILEANGSKFLAYDDRRVDYAPAPGFGPYGYFIPATVAYPRTCETTVEVLGGKVRSWNLRGNGC